DRSLFSKPMPFMGVTSSGGGRRLIFRPIGCRSREVPDCRLDVVFENALDDRAYLGSEVHLCLAYEHRGFLGRYGEPGVQVYEPGADAVQLLDDLAELRLCGSLGFGHRVPLRL